MSVMSRPRYSGDARSRAVWCDLAGVPRDVIAGSSKDNIESIVSKHLGRRHYNLAIYGDTGILWVNAPRHGQNMRGQ